MPTYIGIQPISTTSLVSYIDSWNQRCLTGFNQTTFIPILKDLLYQTENFSVNNVHYQPNSKNLYYDGTNMITLPANANYNNIFASGGSVCAIINPYSTGPSNNARIIGKSSDGAEFTTGWWLNLYDSSSGYASLKFFRAGTSGYGLWSTDRIIKLNSNHLITLTYSDSTYSTAPKIYVDTKLVTVSTLQAPTTTIGNDSSSNIQIGNGLLLTRGYEGLYNINLLYKSVLSQIDINNFFNTFKDRYSLLK